MRPWSQQAWSAGLYSLAIIQQQCWKALPRSNIIQHNLSWCGRQAQPCSHRTVGAVLENGSKTPLNRHFQQTKISDRLAGRECTLDDTPQPADTRVRFHLHAAA